MSDPIQTNREKLQALLRELFQFDSADLDFGYYAVMNQRRKEVDNFIEKRLLDKVYVALEELSGATKDEARTERDTKRAEVVAAFGDEAFDDDRLTLYETSPLGKAYLAAQEKYDNAKLSAETEVQVFNDLYHFFQRYYDDGDFIAQRRYGRTNEYAIPYNGQEVYLHWANADQYYVKSGAYFENYTFTLKDGVGTAPDATVHFRIAKLDTPRDNTKGERRFFVHSNKPSEWDDATHTLIIYFEYRPLTEDEAKRLPTRDVQKALRAEAASNIPNAEAATAIKHLLLQEDKRLGKNGDDHSVLYYHLRRYDETNTRDFFVHKDLGRFLRTELDYYLKAEVLQLDDFAAANSSAWGRPVARLSAVRTVALDIIAFLDQLESFQRMLFLKRKFVLQSDYCLTLNKIPEAARKKFYAEILANEAQRRQWKELYDVLLDETADLGGHPRLLIDTALFDADFKDKLLSVFEDLETDINGVLVQSENFQALRLLSARYRGQVQCVYADPPYNAKSSEILYKNTFKHSAWVSMMANRIDVAADFRASDGALITAIDENEQVNLSQLLRSRFATWQNDCITIVHNPAGVQGDNFSYSHEYALFSFEKRKNLIGKTQRTEESEEAFRDWGGTSARNLAKNCFYPIIVWEGEIIGFGDVCPDDFHPGAANVKTDDEILVYPIAEDGEERKWVFARDSVEGIWHELNVRENDGEIRITRTKTTTRHKTVWTGRKYYANIYGSKLLNGILGKKKFDFPKSLYTVQDCLHAVRSFREKNSVALDYFAGSGTTGHAVIDLNRKDMGNRKYVLIEMGDHFETALRPRITKVIYAPEWKKGKPVKPASDDAPHMFQYLRLESYDDVWHNITLREVADDQRLVYDQIPDYMLTYLLDTEAQGSPTLLNIDAFARPFDYKLKVTGNDGALREQPVDLVTTFNFLLGITVRSIVTLVGPDEIGKVVRVLGEAHNGNRVCILWRNAPPSDDTAAHDREKEWLQENVLKDLTLETLYMNGLPTVPRALMIEDEFKRRMMEGAH